MCDATAFAVAGNNFIQSCGDRKVLAVGTRSHIRIQQGIGHKRRLTWEYLKPIGKAAFFCLDVRAGVIGDKPADAIVETSLAEPDGSIEWMKACVANIRRVAEVVQPRRCLENLGVRSCEQHICQSRRFPRNRIDVHPSPGQGHLKMTTRYLLSSFG